MRSAVALALCVLGTLAHADTVLRIATVAPEGTAWAHVARDFARDVETRTGGAVKVKWYFGGVAGSERQQLERIERGQLDGMAATVACERIAPSMAVAHVFGVVQSRAEASYMLSRIRPTLDEELKAHGYVPLVVAGFGSTILFSRNAVHSLEDLRGHTYWVWNEEPVLTRQLEAMGVKLLPLALEDARAAYEDGRIDGFFSIPAAALAFQWTPLVHYFTDLRSSFITGCLVVSERSYYRLSAAQQQVLKNAGDLLARTFEVVMARQDEQLTGGLLQKQGVQGIPVSNLFRSQFFDEARRIRASLSDLVPNELVTRVMSLLADWRAEHPNGI